MFCLTVFVTVLESPPKTYRCRLQDKIFHIIASQKVILAVRMSISHYYCCFQGRKNLLSLSQSLQRKSLYTVLLPQQKRVGVVTEASKEKELFLQIIFQSINLILSWRCLSGHISSSLVFECIEIQVY